MILTKNFLLKCSITWVPKAFLRSTVEIIRSFIPLHFSAPSGFPSVLIPTFLLWPLLLTLGCFSHETNLWKGCEKECKCLALYSLKWCWTVFVSIKTSTSQFFQLPWSLLFMTSSEYKGLSVKWDGSTIKVWGPSYFEVVLVRHNVFWFSPCSWQCFHGKLWKLIGLWWIGGFSRWVHPIPNWNLRKSLQ